MTWHDMTWHDMTWHDMTWHDMTWHDMTWHDMTLVSAELLAGARHRVQLPPGAGPHTGRLGWVQTLSTQKYKWKQPWMLSHCQPSNTFYFPIWYLLQYEYPIKRMVLSRKYFADGMTFYLKVLRAVSFLKENFRKFVILLLRCLLFL